MDDQFNIRQLKFTILKALDSTNTEHKINMIGRTSQRGTLELELQATFTAPDRRIADRAFEELKRAGLIAPTYSDIVDPESWVEITESGRDALGRGALDKLDEALLNISPHLVELRDGAWAALISSRPDSLRQAAHSARELIDQTLKEGAPDEVIKSAPDFAPDNTSRSGVTRRHRLKYLVRHHRGDVSDALIKSIDKSIDFLLAEHQRLTSQAHGRGAPDPSDVRDCLDAAEMILRKILA